MAPVTFVGVTKVFRDGTVALDDLNLVVPDGSLFVFVGPSGCGKTTLLRLVAGLESAKEPPKAEKPAPAPRPAARPPHRPARDPRPEIEGEADDFGSGLVEEVTWKQAALYDPGPEAVAEDSDELGEAPEPLDDTDEPEDAPPTTEGVAEGSDGITAARCW